MKDSILREDLLVESSRLVLKRKEDSIKILGTKDKIKLNKELSIDYQEYRNSKMLEVQSVQKQQNKQAISRKRK